ncbi:helix-turn-helix domain-containing protein [Paenibacillus sp. GCM10012307]|nr:helix-turn-helix transcriptional regulator [Paenibacillus roseus]
MSFAQLMRTCREKAKLTQEAIAERMYISRSAVARLESGMKWDVETARKWSQLTNSQEVLAAYLFGVDIHSIITNIMPFLGG